MSSDSREFKFEKIQDRADLAYGSADPTTDLRRVFAGMPTHTLTGGAPTRTTSGEWMLRTVFDLPYSMLASLEAAAGSEDIGDVIRSALAAAGHGSIADAAGVRSDRYVTNDERWEELGMPRKNERVRQAP